MAAERPSPSNSLQQGPSYYERYYQANNPPPPAVRMGNTRYQPREQLTVEPPEEDAFSSMGIYCWKQPDHLPAPCGCDSIFVGSVRHAASLHLLRRFRITHVLNCAAGECTVPTRAYAARGIAYAELPCRDEEGYPLLHEKHLTRALSFLHPCLMAGGGGRALVHCVAGRNRSATIAIAAVMCALRKPLPVVLHRFFHRRPFVLTNLSFRSQLKQLADVNGLLDCPQGLLRVEGSSAGPAGRGVVCEHCMQPHAVTPDARVDFSLRADCSRLTVAGLSEVLHERLGQPRSAVGEQGGPQQQGAALQQQQLQQPQQQGAAGSSGSGGGSGSSQLRIDVEVEGSAGGGTAGSLLLPATYELPVVAFGALTLAELPNPIKGPSGRPAALLLVYDQTNKWMSTVGVYDSGVSSPLKNRPPADPSRAGIDFRPVP